MHPIPQCYMDHVSQHAFLPLLSSRERHYGAVTIRQDPDGRSDGYWKNECGISQAIVYLYISIVTCLMYDRSDEVIRCRHMSDGSRKVALPYLPVLVSCIPSRTFSELCHCMASMLALYRPEILQPHAAAGLHYRYRRTDQCQSLTWVGLHCRALSAARSLHSWSYRGEVARSSVDECMNQPLP